MNVAKDDLGETHTETSNIIKYSSLFIVTQKKCAVICFIKIYVSGDEISLRQIIEDFCN